MDNEKLINDLIKRIEKLEMIVSNLQRNSLDNTIYGPDPSYWQPTIHPAIPSYTKAKCSKCGIEVSGVMGYCCPHGDCPCGMGPIMCSTMGEVK